MADETRAGRTPNLVVERHYTIVEDPNLGEVLTPIPKEKFDAGKRTLKIIKESDPDRYIGEVNDESPAYYQFTGGCYFMRNGVAQWGIAVTTAQPDGFEMIRLFSRDVDSIHDLESEVGFFRNNPLQKEIFS